MSIDKFLLDRIHRDVDAAAEKHVEVLERNRLHVPSVQRAKRRLVGPRLAGETDAIEVAVQVHQAGTYRIDDPIPLAGKVVRIRGRFVDFENQNSARIERLSFDAGAAPAPYARVEPGPPPRGADGILAELDDGIKQVNDTTYEIDRGLVEKIIANPTAIRGARIVTPARTMSSSRSVR
jgi:hypothetical protein